MPLHHPYTPQSDAHGGGAVSIDDAHYRIHQGLMYSAPREVALGASASDDIILVTPSAPCEVHLEVVLQSVGAATAELYEGPTVGALGTLIPSYNRYRDSELVAGMMAYHTNTAVTPPAVWIDKLITGGLNRAGGVNRGAEEWVLKPSTMYLLRSTSLVASNTVVTIPLWYEITEVDDAEG